MSNTYNQLLAMIETVARALGDDLLPDVAFVGGCTTGLQKKFQNSLNFKR